MEELGAVRTGSRNPSDETRSQNPINLATGLPVPTAVPSIYSDVNMPEITLTYRATGIFITLFAATRKASSCSFSVGTPVLPGLDNSFGDEKRARRRSRFEEPTI